jgi:DeoR/GlpR family transcriptional regulator of sugar metabolism
MIQMSANANATLTINQVSERINVSPRTIRKVLRANFDETPGRGGRYAIRESDLPALTEMVNSHTAKAAQVIEFPAK